MSVLIEDITIDEYMKAWYRQDYSKLTKEQTEQAYCEYMDLSGLYQSKQFQQLAYINYLTVRVATMSTFVEIERQFTELFSEPYVDGFELCKRYHHSLYWDGNVESFMRCLDKIERREGKYIIELKQQKHLFLEEQSKQVHERKSLQESRSEFVKNINTLGKTFRIDRFKTMMDEYALMIKETLQEQKSENAAKLTKHRN